MLNRTATDPYVPNTAARSQEVRVTSINSSHRTSTSTPASPHPSMPTHGLTGLTPRVASMVSSPADAAVAWASLASIHLRHLPPAEISSLFTTLIPHLTPAHVMHVASLLPARVNRDFLADLPPEIALHILGFVDDVKTLGRASQVSRTWHAIIADEALWRVMCARRGYEAEGSGEMVINESYPPRGSLLFQDVDYGAESFRQTNVKDGHDRTSRLRRDSRFSKGKQNASRSKTPIPLPPFSYRKHFKTAYLTESNWRHSGCLLRSHRSQDTGVVTSLALDSQWIAVGLENGRVHVFSTSTGVLARTLVGHNAGVWTLCLVSRGGGVGGAKVAEPRRRSSSAYVPERGSEKYSPTTGIGSSFSSSSSSSSSSGDLPFQSVFDSLRPDLRNENARLASASLLQSDPCNASRGWGQANAVVISGGCDKQIRVWDVKSGYCLYVLRGHRSTIRCMKVLHGRPIAVSGSRDHTLRVWDVQNGTLLRTLEGHTDSVRSLDAFDDRVVSGSYDCTVRLWDVNTGECLRIFNGHYHQVYSVAFDGERIASGGLDTTVRIWSASTGACLALLQGHTALVCQLQFISRSNTLVTGSSDGRIIIFSVAPAHASVASLPTSPPPVSDVLASPPSSPSLNGEGIAPIAAASQDATFRIVKRFSAHSSSITGLQSDDRRWVVSGGNDGRVLLWDHADGDLTFVRDLTEQCDYVWKLAFREDVAVICCRRAGRTVIEIWSFRPVEEDLL